MQLQMVTSPEGDRGIECSGVQKKDPNSLIRRRKLQLWIDRRYGGNKSDAARDAGKPATQIIEMLSETGNRAFGAKIARELEERLKMPKFYLELDDEQVPPKIIRTGEWPFDFSKDMFERLTDEQQRLIGQRIEGWIEGIMEDADNATEKKRRRRAARP